MDRLEVTRTQGVFLRVNVPLMNIKSKGNDYFVSYKVEQNKTEAEKATARHNIGITDEMYEFIETGEGGGGTGDVNVDNVTIKKKTDEVTGKKVLTAVDSILEDEGGIKVMGVNVGNLHDGDTIESGSTIWSVIRRMLTNVIDVHVVVPSITMNSSVSTRKVEVGTTITQTFSVSYTDGSFVGDTGYAYDVNAGCAEGATSFYKGSVSIESTDTTSFGSVGSVVFSAETEYGASTVTPKKNDGTDSSVSISAGTATSSITYTANKKIFYGGNVGRLDNNNDIRELLDWEWNGGVTLNVGYVGVGVLVVMPSGRSISSAVTSNNENWTDAFTYYDVTIEYANGASETYTAALVKPSTPVDVSVRIILS